MPKKLMIIDDEENICALLKKIFSAEEYEILTETDPAVAIETVRREKPDCVLLDIMMPKIDGIEVLSRINQFSGDIRVIMITGYGKLENAMESMKLGAYDYITKPFDMDFIKSVVKHSLEPKEKK